MTHREIDTNCESSHGGTDILCQWTARKIYPMVPLYVAGIFLGFIGFTVAVQSKEAVIALATTGVGSIVALLPGVLSRLEYKLTPKELLKRPATGDDLVSFQPVFSVSELSHFVMIQSGFKFFKPLGTTRRMKRFIRKHLMAEYSGEVHVDRKDRERVRDALHRAGILDHTKGSRPSRDPGETSAGESAGMAGE